MRFAHRRVRRRDFSALAELFTACGLAPPPPDRASLRRFRNIVADLGVDLYVAVERERIVGMVHTVYTRHFSDGAHAQIIALLVDPERRRLGVGASLLHLARQRATRRGCRDMWIAAATAVDEGAAALFRRDAWVPASPCFRVDLEEATGQIDDPPTE